jgi:hypothetical protein
MHMYIRYKRTMFVCACTGRVRCCPTEPRAGRECVVSACVSRMFCLHLRYLYNQGLVVGFVINVDNYDPLFFIRL